MNDQDTLALEWVAPTELRTTDQIRDDATPDDQLIESVRAHGVLQPPTVMLQGSEYVVVFGHRRVGAAVVCGLDRIPVLVVDETTVTEAIRREQQLVENERRTGLSPREVARGWADLEGMFGLTVEDIAAAVGEKPDRVSAGIRAARSEKTAAILAAQPAIDLEKAAVLTEFDEHPKVQLELAEYAESRPGDFDWKVRDARTRIAKEERVRELKAQIKADGVKLAKVDAYGTLKDGAARLKDLVTAEGKNLTPKRHASCPGHAARVSGWSIDDLAIEYVCTDWETNGHKRAGAAPRELTEDEKRERAEREAHAAAVEANRAARRQWIRDLLPGKINQLPGVYAYMAAALLTKGGYYYEDHRHPTVTLTLLGQAVSTGHAGDDNRENAKLLTELATMGKVAPFRLLLATALAIHEDALANARPVPQVRHYEQLQQWGYVLSEIDEGVLASARARIEADRARAEEEAAAAAAEQEGDLE